MATNSSHDGDDGSSFTDKLKQPFRELEEKLQDTHLHDAKIALVHKKNQLGRLANLVSHTYLSL